MRVLQWLVRLFPSTFRERYGDEVLDLLRWRAERAYHRSGRLGVARLWGRETVDLIRSVVSERRLEQRRSAQRRRPPTEPIMTRLAHDLYLATRSLRRNPVFTAVTILTLALGIGATTSVFTVLNGVLLKPLPYADPDRLVGVWHTAPGIGWDGNMTQSPATYFTYREESRVFEDVGLWDNTQVTVTGLDEPDRVDAMRITDGTVPILGVAPLLGRSFTAEEAAPGSPLTVMLSHGYWQRRFGGDTGVLGRTLTIDGVPREIIGVLPPDFWTLRINPAVFLPFRFNRSRIFVGDFSYQALARLRPGVTVDQAEADVARMITLAMETFPGGERIAPWRLGPDVHPLLNDVVGDVRTVLWIVMGTVGIVLLIACANVANLFLVRTEGRRRELAIRTAIGASNGDIARHLILESVTLGVLGGAAGLGVAFLGVKMFTIAGPDAMPRLADITVDPVVVSFTAGIAMLAGLLFGFLPALRYRTVELAGALNASGRGGYIGRETHRARNTLVVSQVALALVLIVGSGLMIRSFLAMQRVSPGFDRPEEVLTFRIAIPNAEVDEPAAAARMHEEILRRIQPIRGVTSAAISSSVTMDGWDSNDAIHVETFPVPDGRAVPVRRFKWISPGYFATMGNTLRAGRDLTWNDVHTRARVVVVTENFAREYWAAPQDALGQRVRENPQGPWREIVGVVGNVYDDGIERGPTAVMYWPAVTDTFWGVDIFAHRTLAYVVRSVRVNGTGLLDDIRRAVWSLNANLPVANVQTLKDIYASTMQRTSFTLVILATAAVVALLLGGVGIYGVISYVVSRRTREIGVRMALGAKQGDVRRMFLRNGLVLAVAGVGVGLIASLWLTRFMASLLYGVQPIDPLTYGSVTVVVVSIALLASYIPARRAASVDPLRSLRTE